MFVQSFSFLHLRKITKGQYFQIKYIHGMNKITSKDNINNHYKIMQTRRSLISQFGIHLIISVSLLIISVLHTDFLSRLAFAVLIRTRAKPALVFIVISRMFHRAAIQEGLHTRYVSGRDSVLNFIKVIDG